MIETAQQGALGRITLAAPERHNALDRAGMADLAAAFDRFEADGAIRAIVLTGAGRSFCAGAVLGDVAAEDWTENPFTPLCARVEASPLPVVAALNGGVYGGGVDLALAADIRIGVTGMRIKVPAAELGIHYPASGLRRAAALLGPTWARRVFVFAERVEGADLVSSGFADAVVAPDKLVETAEGWANRLAGLAPLALQGMKQSLREILDDRADPDVIRARTASCFASDDHREGLAAQADRRPPVFRGR
ncbi:MAG: enoyl-CoA hydratase-related protein [Pseudomonadota bacterium]